jgi:hypothetical protein
VRIRLLIGAYALCAIFSGVALSHDSWGWWVIGLLVGALIAVYAIEPILKKNGL